MRPKREFVLSRDGKILSYGPARYDTIAEYTQQFDRPTSVLSLAMTFNDPLYPDMVLLVVGEVRR